MARPGLADHRKFRRLVHMLGCPVPHARGYLECMWEVGYKDGEPLLGDDHDVALAAQYPGPDVAKFVAALAECGGPGCAGFIEKAPDGRWMIHHLLENAPSYVQGRIRMRRYREQHRTNTEQCSTVAQPLRNGYASPAPAPAPAPIPNTPLTPLAGGNELFAAQEPEAEKPKAKTPRKRKPPFDLDAMLKELGLDTPEFRAAWAVWDEHRRKKGKFTDTTIRLQLKKLAGWGQQRAIAACYHSATQGWTGLFEPTCQGNGQKRLEPVKSTYGPNVQTSRPSYLDDPNWAKVKALPADQRAELRQQVLAQEADHGTRRWLEKQDDRNPELCGRIVALLENAQAYDPTMATAQQKGSAKALQAAG